MLFLSCTISRLLHSIGQIFAYRWDVSRQSENITVSYILQKKLDSLAIFLLQTVWVFDIIGPNGAVFSEIMQNNVHYAIQVHHFQYKLKACM